MKKSILLLSALLMSLLVFAQAPLKMSYQTVIRNATDDLVSNTTVGIQISVLQGSAVGTAVYVETHVPMTNANGLASVEIGGGAVVTGTMAAIDWGTGPYYVKSEVDPTGGTSYILSVTSELLSVPYALHSGDDGDWEQTPGTVSTDKLVGIGISEPSAQLDVLGGDWDLESGNPGDLRIGNEINNFRIGVATDGGGAGITRLYTNSNALFLGANDALSLILEPNGEIKAPSMTNELIESGGDKSLITKEYALLAFSSVDQWSESGSGINTSSFTVGINSEDPLHTLDVRSQSLADPAGLNVSNADRSRYVRLFSGSETFPDPSMSWAPNHNFIFSTFDDITFDFQEKMRISSDGRITAPSLTNDLIESGGNKSLVTKEYVDGAIKAAIKMYTLTHISDFINAEDQALIFGQTEYNLGGGSYNNTVGEYTVPHTGVYDISTTLRISFGETPGSELILILRVLVNGSIEDQTTYQTEPMVQENYGQDMSFSSHFHLNEGDVVSFKFLPRWFDVVPSPRINQFSNICITKVY